MEPKRRFSLPKNLPKGVLPRVRGEAVKSGDRWGWSVMVTFELDKHIANLPAVNAELVEIGDSLTLSSLNGPDPETWATKEEAFKQVETHAKNISGIICDVLGIKKEDQGMFDMKTGQSGTDIKDGRVV